MRSCRSVALAVLLWGASAAAEDTPAPSPPVTSSLSWVRLPGAEGCISTAELASRVEERLGRRTFVSPSVAALSIEGRAELSSPGHFRLVVTGTRRDGQSIGRRELKGAVCRDLDQGLVLVLALMIDPNASLTEPPPVKQADPVPPPPVAPAPVAVAAPAPLPGPASTPAAVPERSTTFALLGSVGPSFGRAESAVTATALGLRAELLPRVPVEASVHVAFPATLATGAATHYAIYGSLSACAELAVQSQVSLAGCIGFGAGALHASGTGTGSSFSGTRGLFDALTEARVLLGPWGPLRPFLSGGPTIPVIHQRLTALDANGRTNVLFERPTVGLDLRLGVIVRFSP